MLQQFPSDRDEAPCPLGIALQKAGKASVHERLPAVRAARALRELGFASESLLHERQRAARARRVKIELCERGLPFQQRDAARELIAAYRARHRGGAIGAIGEQRFDKVFVARPTRKAVFARDHELDICEPKLARRNARDVGQARVVLGNARERGGVERASAAQQTLRGFPIELE